MSATDPFLMIGKTLAGHFLVQSLVGEGRFSIVYKGLHIGPKKPVALKCYKLGAWLDSKTAETFLRRFREESKPASQLGKEQSHFVVRSIGSGMTTSDDGTHVPYTVLEWLEGRSLARDLADRRARGEGGRPLTEIVNRLGPAVKTALTAAHDQKIFHGDINPGSFFLVGQDQSIKILDVGVAKVMRDLSREIAPQAPLEKLVSPAHAAPEHADAAVGEWGPWTDVYGLALVLLEAMLGRPVAEIGSSERFAKPPTPRALGLAVFDPVESVFAKALALSPAERWPDARAFWSALENAVRAEEPTRRVLPQEDTAETDTEEAEEPSTEPRPAMTGPKRSTTDDTSPNGALIELPAPPTIPAPPEPAAESSIAAASRSAAAGSDASWAASIPIPLVSHAPAHAAPSHAAPSTAAPSPAAKAPAPKGAKAIVAPAPTSAPASAPPVSAAESVSARPSSPGSSGSAGLFKIPPPTPHAVTPKKVHTTPPPPPQPVARTIGNRSFPSTPAKPRSDVPAAKIPAAPLLGATVPVAPPSPTGPVADVLKRQKPEPVEVRRDTPTMPIEPVQEKPRLSPVPERPRLSPVPSASEVSPKESEVAAPEPARPVREMVPPPKANVAVGDLPSVIVDDPELRKQEAMRHRETVRLAMRTPGAPWEPASPSSDGQLDTLEDSEPIVYPPRALVKKRGGLWIVALVSFIVVFLLGAVFIALWHYSNAFSMAP